MSDLAEIQASLPVKIIGTDLTGVETLPVNSDSDGLKVSQKPLNENTDHVQIYGKDQTTGLPIVLNLDQNGNLIVTALSGYGASFDFGDVATAALTSVPVMRTAYNEPATTGQRSFASANANDTLLGTGARSITLTYIKNDGSGPYKETLNLNGTTGVNTVATDIRFVENVIVETVGSGGANAGIITMYTAINKGGTVIGTVSVGDNQTYWAHHYIPTGKICNITGVSCGSTSTSVGMGAVFILKGQKLFNGNPDIQISDFIRLYGQSSTFSRVYQSPIKIEGPSRIALWVTPESVTANTYRGAFDFFEP
jgi:hypothetical protein